MSLVLTPSTRSQRDRLQRLGLLFLLAALPVAAVLVIIINWWVAVLYTVVQTSVLLFGVRQQRTSVLRVDDAGIQYEAGTFVLRTTWADVSKVGEATLPSGPTQALVLSRSGLRWTHTPQVRNQVTTRGWDRIIPIDEFEPNWPDGPLAKAVRAHRPDLLG
ncbi:hypothetical protein KSP35_17370 [Aquihabitans sp. G128]|uniref:hypothetical protein n=1 Tax=Aquihabitans sp. G128 TaxID=2849779 RepID=UPI001C214B36|nr:hypothetical protein [Aquihabitans sp. G128]QXC60114.1 hypothetical protein KSP35_17370 [Aquihabitans sp. G128]